MQPVQAGQDVLECVLGALLQLDVNVNQVLVAVVVVAVVVLLLDDREPLMQILSGYRTAVLTVLTVLDDHHGVVCGGSRRHGNMCSSLKN